MSKKAKPLIFNKSKRDILTELDNYPDVLLTEEVMKILDIVDNNIIYKLLKSGEIKCPKLHKDYIIPRSTVRHYIMDLPNENFINTKEVELHVSSF